MARVNWEIENYNSMESLLDQPSNKDFDENHFSGVDHELKNLAHAMSVIKLQKSKWKFNMSGLSFEELEQFLKGQGLKVMQQTLKRMGKVADKPWAVVREDGTVSATGPEAATQTIKPDPVEVENGQLKEEAK